MNLGHFITKNVQIARAFLYLNFCWTPTIMYHSHWESSRFCIPWWLPFALKSWGSCCSRRYQSHTFWIRYRQGLLWQRRIPENLKQQQPITSLYLSSLMADAAAFWVCSNNSFEYIVGRKVVCVKNRLDFAQELLTQMNQKFWQINLENKKELFLCGVSHN